MLEIKKFSKREPSAWDQFVLNHPHATLYHLIGWRKVIAQSYSYRDLYLVAKEGKKIVAIFPGFIVRGKVTSLPFCNYGGILDNDLKARQSILNWLKKNFRSVELREIQRSKKIKNQSPEFVTSILDLKPGKEKILADLSKKIRRRIRRAEKSQFEIRLGKKNLSDFYVLYQKNMRRLGTPGHSLKFFEKIFEIFPGKSEIIGVYKKDQMLAGAFLFFFKKNLVDLWAASDKRFSPQFANLYLYWKMICFGCEKKFESLDFGRSTLNSGVHDFKKRWGAKTIPLNYLTFDQVKSASWRGNKKFFSFFWSKLPLFIANKIGPKIRRFIP